MRRRLVEDMHTHDAEHFASQNLREPKPQTLSVAITPQHAQFVMSGLDPKIQNIQGETHNPIQT